jgi:hypothetical protein
MFEFNPDLIAADDDEADDTTMYRQEDEEMEGAAVDVSDVLLSAIIYAYTAKRFCSGNKLFSWY